jgi:hypothetical protein
MVIRINIAKGKSKERKGYIFDELERRKRRNTDIL